MQDFRDAGREGCRKIGMQEQMNAGKEGCRTLRTAWMQYRRDAVQKVSRTGGI